MSWSPKQYTVFEDQRTRPVRDLLNAVSTTDVMAAIDLGCGPGNSTGILVDRFPNVSVSGIDSSADMIESARQRLPKCQFTVKSIEAWDGPGPFDVILANAALHWVPNHASLLPRLIKFLSSRGSLAIQMPDNLNEPAHRLMREIAVEQPWADKLAKSAGERTIVESADWYYSLLRPLCSRVDIWRTTYHHPLAGGANAVVEWFKGSGLRPFLLPLNDVEQERYLSQYRAAVSDAYPTLSDGTVLLPFPRLFIVASR
ncbi:trans-aconitate 2-methyltransferase [Pectobacteriaceae bacterium C52]|nr:trans-aconitate 2-methyltransferase [Pectobacteriaceae bacterium C52]